MRWMLLGLALAACGGDDDDDDSADPGTTCADQAAVCRGRQQGCEDGPDGAVCVDCEAGQYAAATGTCTAIDGEPLSHDFEEFTTEPGEEVLALCQSWTLDNEEPLFVNTVELVQDEASHHSNWLFVPDSYFEGPDGVWPCAEREYHQTTAALYGGVLYAQSTQATHEVQKFPAGAVVRMPAHARVIGDVHLLNVTQETVTGHANLTLYTIDERDVSINLAPMHMTYDGLALPPQAHSRFGASCDLASAFADNGVSRFDVTVYWLLPHTHALGRRMYVDVVGGELDGQHLLDVGSMSGDPLGKFFDTPLPLPGATGLSFGCEFDNPTDEVVHWGFGDQEMCEFLGFADSGALFETTIEEANPQPPEGDMQVFTGPCDSLVVPWR